MSKGRKVRAGAKGWTYGGSRPYFGFRFKCDSKPFEGSEQSTDTLGLHIFLKIALATLRRIDWKKVVGQG